MGVSLPLTTLDPAGFLPIWTTTRTNLITTDGTTLQCRWTSQVSLNTTAIEYLTAHPEIKHGEIRCRLLVPMKKLVGDQFGCSGFDVDLLAHTVDGILLGELQWNLLSSWGWTKRRNVHPGTAKVGSNDQRSFNWPLIFANKLPPSSRINRYSEGHHLDEYWWNCRGSKTS